MKLLLLGKHELAYVKQRRKSVQYRIFNHKQN